MSDDPTPEEIAAAFADLPRIDPNAIHEEDGLTGNIICSICWAEWLRQGHFWRAEQVTVVTVHDGKAMCEEHFRAAIFLASDKHDG